MTDTAFDAPWLLAGTVFAAWTATARGRDHRPCSQPPATDAGDR
ncbi:hypothetical protein [Prauserella halophila]|nr:hypothetical protein [Prauserella halophila]MCP2236256.1 hypothetical protein [Prauserella halophila]